MKTEAVSHISHPFKVESYSHSRLRRVLIGRVMFQTKDEAIAYVGGTGDGGEDLPVLNSKPGDTELA